jgi:hypothetical protein
MERQQVTQHLSKCPHTLIPCKYHHIGCDTKLKRGGITAHEQDDKLHLHMALDAIDASMEDSLTLKNRGSITIAVPDFQKIKEANEMFESTPTPMDTVWHW